MSETKRVKKSPEQSRSARAEPSEPIAPARANAAPAPAWAAGPVGAPFSLGGGGAVQRKVAIGASNDVYERQADHVAGRVAGGGTVAPGSISPIAPASVSSVGQRQAKPEDKKKEEKPTAPVQRETRPEDTKKDPKAAGAQLQRQADEKKKDEKPASAPVQKQAKPEEKKKDEKPAAAPVQKQAKPDEKKKNEGKPPAATPVQKQAKPEEKKKDEKAATAPLQKQAKPEEKKKEEKPAAAPVQKQTKPEEKKKEDKPAAGPVQKQSKPDEKKKDEKPSAPVQRELRPEDKKKEEVPGTVPVQRVETEEKPKEESGSVQASRADAGASASPSMERVASNAIASKGPGEPLNSATRSALESRMGTDLSDVRVHNDNAAHSAAEALNARAFTHESDIWLGRGESQSDTRLMAHEATHVVQQTGSVHRQLVQRATPEGGGTPPAGQAGGAGSSNVIPAPGGGKIDLDAKKILLPKLEVPKFKTEFLKSNSFLTLPKPASRPEGEQSQSNIWKGKVGPDAEKAAQDKLLQVKGISVSKGEGDTVTPHEEASTDPNKGVRFMQIKKATGKGNYLVGTPAELKSQFTVPRWGPGGKPSAFDVDHKLELQLGGENNMDNLWLLDAHANRSAGSKISNAIRKTVTEAIQPLANKPPFGAKPDPGLARQIYDITYESVVPGPDPPGADARWLQEEVQKAKPFDDLTPVPEEQARKLIGNKGRLAIYPLETGGTKKELTWDVNKPKAQFPAESLGFRGILPGATIEYRSGSQGLIEGIFRPKKAKEGVIKDKPITLKLNEVGGIPYTLTVEKHSLMQSMQYMEAQVLSPIEFKEIDMEEGRGFVARGKLAPSIPIFKKLDIDITLDGNDVTLSKTFTKGDFNFPGPIKVPEASLTLALGTDGLSAEGVVLLEIEQLGKGQVTAGVNSSGGLELTGSFDFDTKLFDPANIHAEYKDGKFSGGGKIGIKAGKVRGIKSASIEASIADGAIDAKGSITPDIPAVEQADLTMHYDEKSGLIIAGDLQLKKDIPGIAGGSIHAEVTKKEDRYIVKASGEATPKIPGISSKLVVSYDDGAFDAAITAGYEKGMLKGTVTVGATNRPVGDDGKPGGPPAEKSNKITIYGGGSVTLQLAPWLQATAAIKFLPNGEVQVTGKIGLPSVLNLFDEKKVEKNIFKIGIDIPILGFSVLGHNVGIFLEIGGGLDLSAGIGPGQLQEVELSVTYNPAHEEDTLVHGHAALHIPAHAGLRLFVSAALGAGIPLVDAKAGVELGGSLGIEGALHAAVDVDWSPQKGLVLDANAEVYAEPKFKFDITGFVLVELDLLFTTKTLYEKRWQLAAVEYGSGLRLGMKLPIHYEEGKPFNISLSDIQFEVPNIDAMSTIKGLFDKII